MNFVAGEGKNNETLGGPAEGGPGGGPADRGGRWVRGREYRSGPNRSDLFRPIWPEVALAYTGHGPVWANLA